MALFSRGRPKAPLWLRWILRLVILLVFFIVFAQDTWRPYLDNWRCNRIATELSEKYGLVIRYGDPSEFYVSPLTPQANIPEKGYFIEPTNEHSAAIALTGVQNALAKYPRKLIKKHLDAVFIPGKFKIYNVSVGGTYLHSWIYIPARPNLDPSGPIIYEKSLHHEFSSFLLSGHDFPKSKWCAVNEPDFNYMTNEADVVQYAARENRKDPSNASSWYAAGFVHDYGMSDMENDFNTYAELAMTQPDKLIPLAQQYPKIKEKTRILVDFYSSLAPELAAYFKKCGLAESVTK